jgi:hypothetical protein
VIADLLADLPFVAAAVLVAYLSMVGPHTAAGRGWFPGGEEDKPTPAPQPEEGK